MVDNLLEGIFTASETCLPILVEQLHDNIHELITIVNTVLSLVREDDTRLPDLEQKQASFLVVERCHADQHLVDQDTKGPPIDTEVMPLLSDHFGSQVLWSTAKSAGQVVLRECFGEAIVNDLQVTLLVKEDVLKFEVSVHDSLLVKVANSHANLERVELDDVLRKALVGLEDLVKFTTSDERHHEVESCLALEQILHANQEWMIAAE